MHDKRFQEFVPGFQLVFKKLEFIIFRLHNFANANTAAMNTYNTLCQDYCTNGLIVKQDSNGCFLVGNGGPLSGFLDKIQNFSPIASRAFAEKVTCFDFDSNYDEKAKTKHIAAVMQPMIFLWGSTLLELRLTGMSIDVVAMGWALASCQILKNIYIQRAAVKRIDTNFVDDDSWRQMKPDHSVELIIFDQCDLVQSYFFAQLMKASKHPSKPLATHYRNPSVSTKGSYITVFLRIMLELKNATPHRSLDVDVLALNHILKQKAESLVPKERDSEQTLQDNKNFLDRSNAVTTGLDAIMAEAMDLTDLETLVQFVISNKHSVTALYMVLRKKQELIAALQQHLFLPLTARFHEGNAFADADNEVPPAKKQRK